MMLLFSTQQKTITVYPGKTIDVKVIPQKEDLEKDSNFFFEKQTGSYPSFAFFRGLGGDHISYFLEGERALCSTSPKGEIHPSFFLDAKTFLHQGPQSAKWGEGIGGILDTETPSTKENRLRLSTEIDQALGQKYSAYLSRTKGNTLWQLFLNQDFDNGIVATPKEKRIGAKAENKDYLNHGSFFSKITTDDLKITNWIQQKNGSYYQFDQNQLDPNSAGFSDDIDMKFFQQSHFVEKTWRFNKFDFSYGVSFLSSSQRYGFKPSAFEQKCQNYSGKAELKTSQFSLGHKFEHMNFKNEDSTYRDDRHDLWAGYIKTINQIDTELWVRKSKDIFVYQGSLSKALSKKNSFYFHAGKSHRFPTVYEKFSPFGGNKNLKPEINHGLVVGIKREKSYEISFFLNQIENFIEVGPAPTYEYKNSEAITHYGLDVSVQKSFNNYINPKIAATYFEMKSKNPTLKRPHFKTTLSNTAQIDERNNFDVSAIYTSRIFDANRFDPKQNVFLHPKILVNIKFTHEINKTASFYLAVENLFNKKYQYPHGYLQRGMFFKFGISVSKLFEKN